MAVAMNVRGDFKQVKRYLNEVDRKAVPRAASGAINQTATRVRKQGIKDLVEQGGYPNAGMVKPHWYIQRASARKLLAIVGVRRSKTPNLIRFKGKQVASGVSHTAWEGGVRYGFIANAGRTAFRRVGRSRLPIEPLWGPMPANEAAREPMPSKMRKTANKFWPDLFREQMRKQLAKVRK